MALFARGVSEYAEQHGNWIITTSLSLLAGSNICELNAYSLRGWEGDGAILGIGSRDELRRHIASAFPW